jgi:hypothetical protein
MTVLKEIPMLWIVMVVNAVFWGVLFFAMLWWMVGATAKSEKLLNTLEKNQDQTPH